MVPMTAGRKEWEERDHSERRTRNSGEEEAGHVKSSVTKAREESVAASQRACTSR